MDFENAANTGMNFQINKSVDGIAAFNLIKVLLPLKSLFVT